MFRAAWTIAHVKGVPIRLHASLLFLIPLVFLSVAGRDLPRLIARWGVDPAALHLGPLALSLVMAGLLVLAVALHELGHALVALRQGAEVRGITLMILGGVTEIHHAAARPGQELWMAFAGPLVNLALLGLCAALGQIPGLGLDAYVVLQLFGILNLALAAFNLLPAFPLDGGRMLRAALRFRYDRARATRITTRIARVLALAGGLLGLLHQAPMLLLLAALIYFAAGSEEAHSSLGPRLAGLKARQAMETRLVVVYPHTELAGIARHLLLSGAQAAVIRAPEASLGVLLPEDLRGQPPDRTAGELLAAGQRGAALQVSADADLAQVLDQIRLRERPALVYDDHNALVGVITDGGLRRVADLRRLAEGLEAAAARLQGDQVDPR